MRITDKLLENILQYINSARGYMIPSRYTVGIYRLDKENGGYCIREVVNESGGVRTIGNVYCMTARECYYFLEGMKAGYVQNA